VIDPASGLDTITDVHVMDEKIIAIGMPPPDFHADVARTINAHHLVVCPGLVDLSVRLREPGAEHKGTILSETRAAANNGITSICCPPDTDPVIDTPAVAELLRQRALNSGMAKVYPLAALTKNLQGTQLAEMNDLKEAGCIGVSNTLQPIENTEVLRHAMEYAANFDLTLFIHPKEPWLGRNGCMHESPISTRLGLTGIPEQAETIAIANHLLLIEMTGVRTHFCRLSTARSVAMIAAAQAQGLPVTADVCAHQLFLTDDNIVDYNAQYRVYPPLRSQHDKLKLRDGVLANTVNAICSDHQPHEIDAKRVPFAMAASGISALDTFLSLTLRFAEEMAMPLSQVLGYVTSRPAEILRLDAGQLAVGKVADICIFNPDKQWTLQPETMHSCGTNSPFLGQTFKGQVMHTLINGKVVFSATQF
jgi:dihydroorotase